MTELSRRSALQAALASTASLMLASPSLAQELPDSARIVVGFPPGGAVDIVARRLGEQLVGKLAKGVIVDNRPGAAGRIAVDIARQSPPDGLTLLLNPAGVLTINPHTFKKSSYDPFKDFTALSLAAMIDFGFAVGPSVPAEVKTFADFVKWTRAQSTSVTYGSPAAGAPPHFVGDLVSRKLGLNMTHVPYRGSTPALNDLFGGQINALVVSLGDLLQSAKAGRVRILASSGPARSRFAPQVPTFAELGVAGLDVRDWFGVYIVGAASPAVVAKVLPVVRSALASPLYTQGLATAGIEATASSPQEMDSLFRTDYVRWGAIVKASGFVAEV